MLEVRAQAMDMMFDTGAVLGLSRDDIMEGFGFTTQIPARFDWHRFARGCDWMLARAGSAAAFEAAARDCFVKSSGTRAQVSVLRLFASPRALYMALHRFGGHSLFSNATTDVQSLGPNRLRFGVTMAGTPSMGFWVVCAGAIAAAPAAMGYPPSVVRFEAEDNRCAYTIEHAQSRSILAKLQALLISVFARGYVLEELEAQKAALNGQLADLERAHRQAERALALQTRFLTTVTHELRTPLAAIIGVADEIAEGALAPAVVAGRGGEIAQSGHRLLQIVNDVMTLERPAVPHPEPFDLESMIDDALSAYAIAARAKGLHVSSTFVPGAPPAVVVDGEFAVRALHCLLDNAVAFTQTGAITVRTAVLHGELRVEVEDTGCGIPLGIQSHIFEPFMQADEALTRAHQGLGLGLAVARRMAQALGGDVTVTSTEGQGSVFTLTAAVAPLDARQPRPPERRLSAPPPAAAQPGRSSVAPPPIETPPPAVAAPTPDPTGRARALVVEDNLVNQKILVRLLASLGLQVDVALNGLEAVNACASQRYDIVFMDLQMPVMDGFRATQEIRRALDVPIFAVTANSDAQFRDRALEVGMNGLLAKPINRETIEHVLDDAITKRL